MRNGSGDADASVLFGMHGFRVRAQTMDEGEWWLAVETGNARAGCPSCGVFDVVPGRSGKVVRDWVRDRRAAWPEQITVATIDAFAGYASAIRDTVPRATLVVDHFHAIRLASEAVNDVRRRVQQATTGHRGRKGDALYGIRRLLLMTWRNLNQKGWDKLRAGLAAGDVDGEIASVWLARELLSEVYAAVDLAHAKRRLIVFFQHAAEANVVELTRLSRTIDRWSDEVLAYHRTGGASNGPTEAINLVIEKIRRIGHGYRNFDNYRRRLLLGCGIQWTTVPTYRIRGRHPAIAA